MPHHLPKTNPPNTSSGIAKPKKSTQATQKIKKTIVKNKKFSSLYWRIVSLFDLIQGYDLPMTAVVMAGGYGTRLRPLTEDLPKPMIPVDGQPIMERIVGQLRDAGVRRVNVTTHYKKEVISEHFGDGRSFGEGSGCYRHAPLSAEGLGIA